MSVSDSTLITNNTGNVQVWGIPAARKVQGPRTPAPRATRIGTGSESPSDLLRNPAVNHLYKFMDNLISQTAPRAVGLKRKLNDFFEEERELAAAKLDENPGNPIWTFHQQKMDAALASIAGTTTYAELDRKKKELHTDYGKYTKELDAAARRDFKFLDEIRRSAW